MTAMQRLAIIDRGEPAMRCISAVAELNLQSREQITTIALYMQDTASSIMREADEAVALSPAASAGIGRQHSTRLDPVRLLAALTQVRADALWAGWGSIADPAELARLCERTGITFIGPGSDVIRLLDDKARTGQLAESIGIPVVPWPGGPSVKEAQLGYLVQALSRAETADPPYLNRPTRVGAQPDRADPKATGGAGLSGGRWSGGCGYWYEIMDRCRGSCHRLLRGHHRMVFGIEVLPPKNTPAGAAFVMASHVCCLSAGVPWPSMWKRIARSSCRVSSSGSSLIIDSWN